jgi:flagellar assembly protein FliH
MSLSSIVEIKPPKNDGRDFVSFETMVGEDDVAAGPTPLEVAQSELEEVQAECERLVADANAKVERIKKEAHDQGFAQGEAAGKAAGEASYDEKLALLARQVVALSNEQKRVYQENEAQLLPLIRAMVEKLVNHEVSVNHKVIETCLAKAMEVVVGQSKVVVHLNPDDFLTIKDVVMEDPLFLEGAGRVELMEDLAVSQGGCLLVTEFGEIDATLDHRKAQLDQAVEQAFLAALAEN